MLKKELMNQAHEESVKKYKAREGKVASAIMGMEEALKNHQEPNALYGLRKQMTVAGFSEAGECSLIRLFISP